MFHCNGWCFPWTIAMLGGTHVCLRKVDATHILQAIQAHKVDHYCAAPIAHNLILAAPESMRNGITHAVKAMVAGAAPPAAMIEGMSKIGFDITHVYGLTEVYASAGVAAKRNAWASQSLSEQTRLNARQGVRYVLQEGMTLKDAKTMVDLPADGETMGEIMFRGNIVMKGYLRILKPPKPPLKGMVPYRRLGRDGDDRYSSKSKTAAKTSSSQEGRTSVPWRSRMLCTVTRRLWRVLWWPSPMRVGGRRLWPTLNLKLGRKYGAQKSCSSTVRVYWPVTRCPEIFALSPSTPRPLPGRFKSLECEEHVPILSFESLACWFSFLSLKFRSIEGLTT
jgi:acyl-CoA synthetase (AMP-forming)/AMP-acid ligase II